MAAWYSGQAVNPSSSCWRMTCAYLVRLGREQLVAVVHPPDHAGRAAAQDQAAQLRLTVEHVLHGQHAAPRAAEQVQLVETECSADLRQFLDEPVDCPQRDVIGTVGVAAAELVVEDHLAAVGQRLQRLQVVVREAGAAVQAQQRRRAAAFAD